MKTTTANNENNIEIFAFETLTNEEMATVKGGKVKDSYCDLI